jgi:hypothetical protein
VTWRTITADKLPTLTNRFHGIEQIGRGMCLDNVIECAGVHGLFDYIGGWFLAHEQYLWLEREQVDLPSGLDSVKRRQADV